MESQGVRDKERERVGNIESQGDEESKGWRVMEMEKQRNGEYGSLNKNGSHKSAGSGTFRKYGPVGGSLPLWRWTFRIYMLKLGLVWHSHFPTFGSRYRSLSSSLDITDSRLIF